MLQALYERRTNSMVAKNVSDREELLKCNFYTLIALRMDSDNTCHEADVLFEQNSVSHFYRPTYYIYFPCRDIRNAGMGGSLSKNLLQDTR